ncbi:MAG TPA: DNA replication and repair protein RecF [Chitinophagaceae bacterium]
MLRLETLKLTQFKNYLTRAFDFRERIVGITGRNGVGKTNLLDAIHYLCFTRSYFTRQDAQNSLTGYQGFRVEGHFKLWEKNETATCILRETGKKEFILQDEPYGRLSKHIGHYPCVVIAPDDIQVIAGGSEERRRFIDTLLAQLDADYLQSLISYTKLLQQRNSLLRPGAESGNVDTALLTVLDEQLEAPANKIFNKRRDFLVGFLPAVKQQYAAISGHFENINLYYESELLTSSFSEILARNRSRDFAWGRTAGGIHRDDLELELDGQVFRNIASQGQRKSLLFALKLAEMQVITEQKGFAPLLLLDDIFEKLDLDRIGNLLVRVCDQNDGQVFITDTEEDRLQHRLENTGQPFQLIAL